MFENATNLRIRPGKLNDCLSILRKHIVPLLRQQPGLLSLALVPDRDKNLIVVLSIWASPACARAIESNLQYRQEICRLDRLVLEHPLHRATIHQTRQIGRQAPSPN